MTRPITLMERELMGRALGHGPDGSSPREYRNVFATRLIDPEWAVWSALEVDGLARISHRLPERADSGVVYFQVTEAGKQALVARPPVPCFLCRILRSHEGGCLEVRRG